MQKNNSVSSLEYMTCAYLIAQINLCANPVKESVTLNWNTRQFILNSDSYQQTDVVACYINEK